MNTQVIRRRIVVARLLALAVAITLIGVFAFAPPARSASQPTIVLVHGAWASPAGWDQVTADLHKLGYETVTPRLNLMSVAEDVSITRAALDATPGQKIMVGHSYGGFVVANAAAGRSDVLGLVYTAAFVPREGESIIALGDGFTPPEALRHLVFMGEPFASPASIDPAFFRQFFAQDLSPKKAAVLNAGQQPVDLSTFFTPSGPTAALPSWYAVSGDDLMIDPAQQRFMAQRVGAITIEFDDASHAGGYTHYAARFAKLISTAVEATGN